MSHLCALGNWGWKYPPGNGKSHDHEPAKTLIKSFKTSEIVLKKPKTINTGIREST